MIFTPSEVQHVQSRLPGSVVEIRAELGKVVDAGEVLYRLEDEDVTANFADNEIALNAARAAELRLTAEAEGLSRLVFPADLTAAAPEMVAKEASLFATRAEALAKRVSVLRDNIATLERTIIEKEAEERISLQKAALVAEEIALLRPLVEPATNRAPCFWRRARGISRKRVQPSWRGCPPLRGEPTWSANGARSNLPSPISVPAPRRRLSKSRRRRRSFWPGRTRFGERFAMPT